jgi:tetratricopeptide (TPR) repeat protein
MPISNDVFISYRRSSSAIIALMVWQNLEANHVDAFYDIESIAAGQFDSIILNQIAARPYFMPLLTPGTLERCRQPGDWLCREINHALRLHRILLPLHTPNFNFADLDRYLPERTAAQLKRFNMVKIPEVTERWFKYALQDISERFLQPIDLPVDPTPAHEEAVVAHKRAQTAAAAARAKIQLNTKSYREYEMLGHFAPTVPHVSKRPALTPDRVNVNEATSISSPIDTKHPHSVEALMMRGQLRKNRHEYEDALEDFTQAIDANPAYAPAYYKRASVHSRLGEPALAIMDYSHAIQLDPSDPNSYNKRGIARYQINDLLGAVADFSAVIDLSPDYTEAYYNRGCSRSDFRNPELDLSGAFWDLSETIRRNASFVEAYYRRAAVAALQQNWGVAIDDAQCFIDLLPDDPRAPEMRQTIAEWRSERLYGHSQS